MVVFAANMQDFTIEKYARFAQVKKCLRPRQLASFFSSESVVIAGNPTYGNANYLISCIKLLTLLVYSFDNTNVASW